MRNVFITGASRGIGFETALAFARAGFHVFAGVRKIEKAAELVSEFEKHTLPINLVEIDVSSDISVREVFEAFKRNRPIDVLVNNAGIQMSGSVEEMSIADHRAVMETNYFGCLRCIHGVVEQMRERQTGYIVNVSSGSGRYSHPPFAAYSASKWALEAMAEALASELKTFGIHVSIVEPVLIATDMSFSIANDVPKSLYRQPARFAEFYAGGLKRPVPPAIVASKIVDIVQTETWQLRHPVGPAAEPLLEYRKQMTDEQWIDAHASDDQKWYEGLAEVNAFIDGFGT